MRKRWIPCALFMALVLLMAQNAAAVSEDVQTAGSGDVPAAVFGSAQAAIVMEQSTGRVLCARNADRELAMASTTKIMTALVVIENTALDEVVLIDERMSGIEGSSMYLEPGEELTVEQLLYGLMLRSGNDAAVALALHVGGSVEGFARMMNDKAALLGLEHTHFVNPHGLPAEGHYTTARELAEITRAAYEYEAFRRIVSTQYVTVPWKGHLYDRAMKNKNKMLTQYPGGNGVKTGYTKAAGRCLVSGAEREGMQLICVVLNAPDMWNDSASMLDYGFEHYDMVQALSALEPAAQMECTFSDETVPALPLWDIEVPLKDGEQAKITLEKPEKIEAGVARGEQIGYANIEAEGVVLARVPLIAGRDVQVPLSFRFSDALRRVAQGWYMGQKQR